MNYFSVYKESEALLVIEKSKFITYTKPIKSEEEALEFIAQIKKKHYDANHNVTAYVLGKNYDIKRYSDDGEPSGTAGMPALDTLMKNKITNVCVVITRYFGGIKLGTGGLVRAYIDATKNGLSQSGLLEYKYLEHYFLVSSYELSSKIQYKLFNSPVYIKDTYYTDNVTFEFYVDSINIKIIDEIVDLTASKIEIIKYESEYIKFLENKIIL